jgi:hypothetical protein
VLTNQEIELIAEINSYFKRDLTITLSGREWNLIELGLLSAILKSEGDKDLVDKFRAVYERVSEITKQAKQA